MKDNYVIEGKEKIRKAKKRNGKLGNRNGFRKRKKEILFTYL